MTSYHVSDLFKNRVDLGISDVKYNRMNGDVSLRINFAKNSFDVIKKNPIIGIGTGDFPGEYKKINKINSPGLPNTTNPHNMYTLVGMQLGLVGIISMLSIFYYQIKLSFKASNKFLKDFGITLPIVFLVIMWSDSYLLGHFTSLMFVFFA